MMHTLWVTLCVVALVGAACYGGHRLARRGPAPVGEHAAGEKTCRECRLVRLGRRDGRLRYPNAVRLFDTVHVVLDDGTTACGIWTAVHCTPVSARWCPVHGVCSCPYESGDTKTGAVWGGVPDSLDDAACPLHSITSPHGEHPPGYAEGIAARMVDDLDRL